MLEERSSLVVWAPAVALAGVPTVVAALAIALIPSHIGGEGSSSSRARKSTTTNLALESDAGESMIQEDEGAPVAMPRTRASTSAAPARSRSRGFSPVVREDPPDPPPEMAPPPQNTADVHPAIARANNLLRTAEEARMRRNAEAGNVEPPAIEPAAVEQPVAVEPVEIAPSDANVAPPPPPVEETAAEPADAP